MKKFLLSAGLIGLGSVAFGQGIQILDDNLNDITGTTIMVQGDNQPFNIIDTHVKVKNISGSSMQVKVKRYETNVQATTQNYFCWFVCYAAQDAGLRPIWPEPADVQWNHFRTIEADSIDNALSMYHRPEGVVGTSLYRYVIFDGNNENDSVFIDVQFEVGYTGIEEQEVIKANHYPNPANNILTIAVDGNGFHGGQVEIHNMVGVKVKTAYMTGSRIDVNVSDLSSGVYFYSILGDRGALVTRRFMVSH